MKMLITGIAGSGGSYLAEYIVNNCPEVEVHGISRWHSTTATNNLKKIRDKVNVHECDLNDFSSVFRILNEVRPDAIFHLAAHANVRASFDTPNTVLSNNILGTSNLLEAVRLAEIDPIIQLCSTSEVYGQVAPENVPIKEDCPIAPSSPYAVSKVAQDLLGHTYYLSYGMQIIRTRMFAYLNPRRTDLFATSFAMQVARIEEGLQKELLHGNLDSVRTLIDVRDAMESYWVAMEKCKPGEVYNIGGPKTIKVGEFLDLLKRFAKTDIPSRVDKSLLRPADVTLQIPDVNKFQKETGWKPKYSFEESVQNLLEHCREVVAIETKQS
jgi:GDPmannose 4,6-dehydratase/GDP-4-dehydro-6-deoxy-D-mannose reductase